jgi:L-fuconolactonase
MGKRELIDSHQHLWVMSERAYDWIEPGYGVIYDDFTPERLEPEIEASGVTGSVLVQAADTYEDTFYMLDIANKYQFVRGVVGFIPLDRTAEAARALEIFSRDSYFKGVRNLTHNYADAKYESDDAWILRPQVLKTLEVVEASGLAFDYVAVNPAHLANVRSLAEKFPRLKIVIDHFAKPNIAGKAMEPWATQMLELAKYPNVYGKFSGLNTASTPNWTVADWQPYVDHMVGAFGAERIMLGGDWPVITLMNNYVDVWQAQVAAVANYSAEDQEWICSKTAIEVYGLKG